MNNKMMYMLNPYVLTALSLKFVRVTFSLNSLYSSGIEPLNIMLSINLNFSKKRLWGTPWWISYLRPFYFLLNILSVTFRKSVTTQILIIWFLNLRHRSQPLRKLILPSFQFRCIQLHPTLQIVLNNL